MTCARKCLIIVSVPLICLKSVCLGWHKVSCWDFNLLTRPSAAVVGSHIGGIKWEAAQHVRPSTCTLANNTITNLCLTHIPIQLHHNHKQMTHFFKRIVHKCSAVPQSRMLATASFPAAQMSNDSPLPAAQGPDCHFIAACHYCDAINGNELADNWFTITLPPVRRYAGPQGASGAH